MIFDTDKQTLADIELFSHSKAGKSLFSVYNQVETKGAEEVLFEMFHNPVSDIDLLQSRKNKITFFYTNNCHLKVNSREFKVIEYYLELNRAPLRNNFIDAIFNGLSNQVRPTSDYYTISQGIFQLIKLFYHLEQFISEVESIPESQPLEAEIEVIKMITKSVVIAEVMVRRPKEVKNLGFVQINRLDRYFRHLKKNELRDLLNVVYQIDVYQSLSKLMKNNGFTLPEYICSSESVFEVTDGFHPFLFKAIPNSISLDETKSLCFITGPNMAGKSTFLKTIALLTYVSHLGFPVSASKLRISLFDGLFTTINLADNMNLGYSHFYAEVKRVKDIVLKINEKRRLFIVFDELFRGTNVKDAYDASLLIISALAKIPNTFFFISTHILEVAESLDNKSRIMFKCFESTLVDEQPVYDYQLKEGISEERIGLQIIKNEKIIDILNSKITTKD